MKINSRILGILSALFLVGILISSASAADDLVSDQFDSESFAIDVPSGSDFNKGATTNLNAGDVAMNMSVFENHGDNSNDVSTVMYLKDSSSNQNIVSDMINDLQNDGKILEENDKFFVIETQNSNNWDFLNIGDDIGSLWGFVDGLFSSDSNVDVSTQDADVKVSSADGIKIVDSENSTVTLSNNTFHVSDANGGDVFISTGGVKVTGNSGSGEASSDANVSVDVDSIPNVGDEKYVVCIKDLDNGQVIVIAGDNLELMKSMAKSASFD